MKYWRAVHQLLIDQYIQLKNIGSMQTALEIRRNMYIFYCSWCVSWLDIILVELNYVENVKIISLYSNI